MGGGGSGVTDNRRAVCAVLVRVCGVRVSGVRVSASKRLTQGMMLPRSTPQLHVDAPGPWRHDTRAHGDSCMGLLGLQFTARPPMIRCWGVVPRCIAQGRIDRREAFRTILPHTTAAVDAASAPLTCQ
jgi:hypothetical protein